MSRVKLTTLDENILLYLKDGLATDMELCERFFYGLSEFTLSEFKSQEKSVARLSEAIKNGGYELGKIDAPEDSLRWLNEILHLTFFYEKVQAVKSDIIWPEEIKKNLVDYIKKVRKPQLFEYLTDVNKIAVKMLNRLTIELAHPDEAPVLGFSDFHQDEFRSQKKDEKELFKIIRFGHNDYKPIDDFMAIDRLNKLLELPSLYDNIIAKNPGLRLPGWLNDLRIRTEENRKRQFKDFTEKEQLDIKKLNRITLEIAHPNEAPRMTTDSIDFCKHEFVSQKKDIMKFRKAVGNGLYFESVEKSAYEFSEVIIKLLNKILQDTSFHERVVTWMPYFVWPEELETLKKQTQNNWGKEFKDLAHNEKRDIKRLNRLTIELIHPKEAPKNFFYKGNQKITTRDRVKRRKLADMRKVGLIDMKEYKTEPCVITIGPLGAIKMANEYDDLTTERMWMHQPREGQVAHDRSVARVARKILWDIKDSCIFFEPALKRELALDKNKSRKGRGFPDFRLEIYKKNMPKQCVDFEIIEKVITSKDLFDKIISSQHDFFILSKTYEKSMLLWKEILSMFKAGKISETRISSIHYYAGWSFYESRVEDSMWETNGKGYRKFREILRLK